MEVREMATRLATGPRLTSLLALLVLASAASAEAAAAAEPPFRAHRYELRSLHWTQLSFSGWHRLPLPPLPPIDAQGMPLVRDGGVLSYAVGEMSMNGMRRLTRWLVRCERPQLRQALAQAAKLRELALVRRRAWWIPHEFDYAPYGLRAPWFNAMTQGLALSFFVRLRDATGDETHMRAARKVFRSFLRLGPGRKPWVAYVDRDRYLWLEHYPNASPDHILNAHLHAVFGLYEYWQASGSPRARRVLEGAITTIRDNLRRYRRPGGSSYYGLRSRSVIPKYHHIHVWQVRLLGAITGDAYFTRMARRLRSDLPGRPTWRGTPGYPPLPESRPCGTSAGYGSVDATGGGSLAAPSPAVASGLAGTIPQSGSRAFQPLASLVAPLPSGSDTNSSKRPLDSCAWYTIARPSGAQSGFSSSRSFVRVSCRKAPPFAFMR
jgi:hypothetical protein